MYKYILNKQKKSNRIGLGFLKVLLIRVNLFLLCGNVLILRNKNLSKIRGLFLRFRMTHVLSHGRSEYFALVKMSSQLLLCIYSIYKTSF